MSDGGRGSDPTCDDGNAEWRLDELVDSIAADIDSAEDTLSLKSYARGITFALKKLSLDLGVTARVDAGGRVLFRTVEEGQSSDTVLKLDFAQVLQNQLEEARKPLHEGIDNCPLSALPGVTAQDLEALRTIAVFTLDDMRRSSRTPAMVAEVARKTGIAEARVRRWLDLPFLLDLEPDSGLAGDRVILHGGNFGSRPCPDAMVLFGDQPARILDWSDREIAVEVPEIHCAVCVRAVIDGAATNTLIFSALSARRPIAMLDADPQVELGQPFELDGSRSRAFGGHRITRYLWTLLETASPAADLNPAGPLKNQEEVRMPNEEPQPVSRRKAVKFEPGETVETKESKVWAAVSPKDPLPVGRNVFQLVVVDDSGNESAPATVVVIVKDTERPTAVLSAPAQVELGKSFELDGSQSSDVPPGKVERYRWTLLPVRP